MKFRIECQLKEQKKKNEPEGRSTEFRRRTLVAVSLQVVFLVRSGRALSKKDGIK